MLHIRHRLRKTVRITFLYFLPFPLSFAPSFVHSFRPFSLFLSTFLSLRSPFFPFCFCCKRIGPCKFTIEYMVKRKLSAIPGRYVTVYACGFAHCTLTEFLCDIQTFVELNFRIRRDSIIIETSGA